ncbi:hypothetical protein SDC9_157281 [bioreactor metagenome]|uniref:Uncharacterized protein n=1 Tax=bioreactor metagenome TaxID=1076179 RepID=A0A645F6J2_9ZZZZ
MAEELTDPSGFRGSCQSIQRTGERVLSFYTGCPGDHPAGDLATIFTAFAHFIIGQPTCAAGSTSITCGQHGRHAGGHGLAAAWATLGRNHLDTFSLYQWNRLSH